MDEEILFKIKRNLDRLGNRSISEAGTKESFINPLITALGWDVSDFDEVKLEYKHTKKDSPVDYALMIDMNPKLFIEAKQLGLNLSDRKWIAQTLTYCTMAGVKWGLLTDGNHYKLYNSMAEARLEEKLFFDWKITELNEKNIDKILNFLSLLTKEKLEKDINDVWETYFAGNKVKTTLLKLIEDKDESLLNLIRKKTKLRRATIVNSINRLKIRIETVSTAHFSLDMKEQRKAVAPESNKKDDYTFKKPKKFRLLNETFDVTTWKDILVITAEKLMKFNPDAFNDLADSEIMKAKKTSYLTKNKNLVREHYQLSNGLFLETNLDASSIVRIIKKRFLKGCGYKDTDIEIFLKD